MLKNFEALQDDDVQAVSGGAYNAPCIVYTMQPGDSLATVAQTYGTTVPVLCRINNIGNPNKVGTNDKLLVPKK